MYSYLCNEFKDFKEFCFKAASFKIKGSGPYDFSHCNRKYSVACVKYYMVPNNDSLH